MWFPPLVSSALFLGCSHFNTSIFYSVPRLTLHTWKNHEELINLINISGLNWKTDSVNQLFRSLFLALLLTEIQSSHLRLQYPSNSRMPFSSIFSFKIICSCFVHHSVFEYLILIFPINRDFQPCGWNFDFLPTIIDFVLFIAPQRLWPLNF